jgi:uncharacterized protein YutE (UPF0331/DUF86 family)
MVHVYWHVDDAHVADYLQTHLSDFDRMAAALGKKLVIALQDR